MCKSRPTWSKNFNQESKAASSQASSRPAGGSRSHPRRSYLPCRNHPNSQHQHHSLRRYHRPRHSRQRRRHSITRTARAHTRRHSRISRPALLPPSSSPEGQPTTSSSKPTSWPCSPIARRPNRRNYRRRSAPRTQSRTSSTATASWPVTTGQCRGCQFPQPSSSRTALILEHYPSLQWRTHAAPWPAEYSLSDRALHYAVEDEYCLRLQIFGFPKSGFLPALPTIP